MARQNTILYIVLLLCISAIHPAASAQDTQSYSAYYEELCGRSLLVLQRPGEKSIVMQATGMKPAHELNYSVLVNVKLTIHGYFTGKHIDDHHCGRYPEFYLTQYSAAGRVNRCASVSDWVVYETLVLYPPGLPQYKFIDLDFVKNRSLLKEVALSRCRLVDKNTVCNTCETAAQVCGQPMNECCLNY